VPFASRLSRDGPRSEEGAWPISPSRSISRPSTVANSLHFHRKKASIVETRRGLLHPGGRLLLGEHNTDHDNAWVPSPIAFEAWEMHAGRCGFLGTRKIGSRPSRFLGEIYAAESTSHL
jgi:hypothetical protein